MAREARGVIVFRRGRKLLAFALTVIAAGGFLGTAAGCSASSPQRAVGDFVRARISGNDDKAAKLTVEEDLSDYIGGEPFLYASDVSFDLEPPETSGDRAVVIVHYRWSDQSVDIPYVTRRIGTKWKVALRETEELWLPDIEVGEEPPSP